MCVHMCMHVSLCVCLPLAVCGHADIMCECQSLTVLLCMWAAYRSYSLGIFYRKYWSLSPAKSQQLQRHTFFSVFEDV